MAQTAEGERRAATLLYQVKNEPLLVSKSEIWILMLILDVAFASISVREMRTRVSNWKSEKSISAEWTTLPANDNLWRWFNLTVQVEVLLTSSHVNWLGFPCRHFYQTDSFLWKNAGFYIFFRRDSKWLVKITSCMWISARVMLQPGLTTFNR